MQGTFRVDEYKNNKLVNSTVYRNNINPDGRNEILNVIFNQEKKFFVQAIHQGQTIILDDNKISIEILQ